MGLNGTNGEAEKHGKMNGKQVKGKAEAEEESIRIGGMRRIPLRPYLVFCVHRFGE